MEITGPLGGAPAGVPPIAWLERVNRLSLLSRLVASTVHDMNNALQVMGGGLELLQMPPVDVAAVSRAIGGKTQRINGLLQDLTRFMRDAGGAACAWNGRAGALVISHGASRCGSTKALNCASLYS